MAYGVVRTDLLQGADVRNSLVSFKYCPSDVDTEIENGNIVKIGSLLDGEREVYAADTPAASDTLHDIVLVATPEVMYDERKRSLDEFRNEAGDIARGYVLHSGDIFSVTADALDFATDEATDGQVGSGVAVQADTKLKVSASAGDSDIGTIHAVETAGRYLYYVIKVK